MRLKVVPVVPNDIYDLQGVDDLRVAPDGRTTTFVGASIATRILYSNAVKVGIGYTRGRARFNLVQVVSDE